MTDPQANKAAAIAFYELMFNECRPRDAVERFVGERYIQHNPNVEDGKEGFIAYFERMAQEYPGKRVRVVRALADGELVALHCHQTWPGLPDYAGIDIFRFDEQGLIVEHWDAIQTVPEGMRHGNGMF